MWPLERRREREYLRLGRSAVERWVGSRTGMVMTARAVLLTNNPLTSDGLVHALRALYAEAPAGDIELVIESAYLPVLLVDTGGKLWTRAEVEALVRHRFGLLYGHGAEPVAGWDIRVDHRGGERHSLGYGLPSELKRHLYTASEQLGLKWHGWQPALTWGWRRLKGSSASCWWAWPEQDRLLLMRIEQGRVIALNAAAAPAQTNEAVARCADVEGARWGLVPADQPIFAASWSAPAHLPSSDTCVSWVSVVGSPPATSAASAASVKTS